MGPLQDAMAPPAPTEVTVESGRGRLGISWESGHRSAYPFWLLRGFCPCAGCQGHGRGFFFHPTDTAGEALDDVLEVGHYALNLTWADGHNTGIYPFELLWRLCMCAACRKNAATEALWGQLNAEARGRWGADVMA